MTNSVTTFPVGKYISRFYADPGNNQIVIADGNKGGIKTNGNILQSGGESDIVLQNTNFTLGSDVANTGIGAYLIKDNTNVNTAYITNLIQNSDSLLKFLVRNKSNSNSSSFEHTLELSVSKNGTKKVNLDETAWRNALKIIGAYGGKNVNWQNATSNTITFYVYEGADTTTFNLPFQHVIVIVVNTEVPDAPNAYRGFAIAANWNWASGSTPPAPKLWFTRRHTYGAKDWENVWHEINFSS